MTPYRATDWAWLAGYARDVAARRHRDYPGLIEAGKLDRAEAARQLALADEIAADWTAIEGRAPVPVHPADAVHDRAGRIATLDQAAERTRARADAVRRALTGSAALHAREMTTPILIDWMIAPPAGVDPDLAAALRPWLRAEAYAWAVAILAWWERRPGFPFLQIAEARRLRTPTPERIAA